MPEPKMPSTLAVENPIDQRKNNTRSIAARLYHQDFMERDQEVICDYYRQLTGREFDESIFELEHPDPTRNFGPYLSQAELDARAVTALAAKFDDLTAEQAELFAEKLEEIELDLLALGDDVTDEELIG